MDFDPVLNEPSEGQAAGHNKRLKELKKRKT